MAEFDLLKAAQQFTGTPAPQPEASEGDFDLHEAAKKLGFDPVQPAPRLTGAEVARKRQEDALYLPTREETDRLRDYWKSTYGVGQKYFGIPFEKLTEMPAELLRMASGAASELVGDTSGKTGTIPETLRQWADTAGDLPIRGFTGLKDMALDALGVGGDEGAKQRFYDRIIQQQALRQIGEGYVPSTLGSVLRGGTVGEVNDADPNTPGVQPFSQAPDVMPNVASVGGMLIPMPGGPVARGLAKTAGVGSRMAVAGLEAAGKSAASQGLQRAAELTANIAKTPVPGSGLAAAAAQKLGAAGTAVRKGAENLAEAVGAEPKVGAGLLEQGVNVVRQPFSYVRQQLDSVPPELRELGLVGKLGVSVPEAPLYLAEKTLEAVRRYRDLPASQSGKLRQLAVDPASPPWLKNVATFLDRTGVGTAAQFAGDLGKNSTSAAVGGYLTGAVISDDPEDVGNYASMGLMQNTFVQGVGKMFGRQAAQRRLAGVKSDLASFYVHLEEQGTPLEIVQALKDNEASVLAAFDNPEKYGDGVFGATALAATYRANLNPRIKVRFLTNEKTRPDVPTFAEEHPDSPNAAGAHRNGVVDVNLSAVNLPGQTMMHELAHNLAKAAGSDSTARLIIDQILGPEGVAEARRQYASLMARSDPANNGILTEDNIAAAAKQLDDRHGGPEWVYSEIYAETSKKAFNRDIMRDVLGVNNSAFNRLRRMVADHFSRRATESGFPPDALFRISEVYGPELRRKLLQDLRELYTEGPGKAGTKETSEGVPTPIGISVEQVRAGTPAVAKDSDGLTTDASGNVVFDRRTANKQQRERTTAVRQGVASMPPADPASTDPGLQPRPGMDGKTEIAQGTKAAEFMEATGKFSATQVGIVRVIEEALAAGKGAVQQLWYNPIGTSARGMSWSKDVQKRLGNIPASAVDMAFYDFHVSSKGHVLARGLSLTAMERRLAEWTANSESPLNKLWNGDEKAFRADLHQYLQNHANNLPGAANGIGESRRNALNYFLIGRLARLADLNPLRVNSAAGLIRSLRVDRMSSITSRTGEFPITYKKLAENYTYAGRSATGYPQAKDEKRLFRGPVDKKMRFEIDDQDAVFDLGDAAFQKLQNKIPLDLGDMLQHDELYQNYPQLRNMPVRVFPQDKPGQRSAAAGMNFYGSGRFDPTKPTLFLNYNLFKELIDTFNDQRTGRIHVLGPTAKSAAETRIKEAKALILHEVQHWIQATEGFSRGNSMQRTFNHVEMDAIAAQRLLRQKDQAPPEVAQRIQNKVRELLKDYSNVTEESLNDLKVNGVTRNLEGPWGTKARAYAAYVRYWRTAGEIEARDVQARSVTPKDALEKRYSQGMKMGLEDRTPAQKDVAFPKDAVDRRNEYAIYAPDTDFSENPSAVWGAVDENLSPVEYSPQIGDPNHPFDDGWMQAKQGDLFKSPKKLQILRREKEERDKRAKDMEYPEKTRPDSVDWLRMDTLGHVLSPKAFDEIYNFDMAPGAVRDESPGHRDRVRAALEQNLYVPWVALEAYPELQWLAHEKEKQRELAQRVPIRGADPQEPPTPRQPSLGLTFEAATIPKNKAEVDTTALYPRAKPSVIKKALAERTVDKFTGLPAWYSGEPKPAVVQRRITTVPKSSFLRDLIVRLAGEVEQLRGRAPKTPAEFEQSQRDMWKEYAKHDTPQLQTANEAAKILLLMSQDEFENYLKTHKHSEKVVEAARKAREMLPVVDAQSPAISWRGDSRVSTVGQGSEGPVIKFSDEPGYVYKILEGAPLGLFDVQQTSGIAGVHKLTARRANSELHNNITKAERLSRLPGGLPAEVVGLTPNGNAILKMPEMTRHATTLEVEKWTRNLTQDPLNERGFPNPDDATKTLNTEAGFGNAVIRSAVEDQPVLFDKSGNAYAVADSREKWVDIQANHMVDGKGRVYATDLMLLPIDNELVDRPVSKGSRDLQDLRPKDPDKVLYSPEIRPPTPEEMLTEGPYLSKAPAAQSGDRVVVSIRVPKAKKAPLAEDITVLDRDVLRTLKKTDPEAYKLMMQKAKMSSGLFTKDEQRIKNPDRLLEIFVDRAKDNLRWLWEQTGDWRDRAKLWYDGAHKIAKELSAEHGFTLSQMGAVLAANSPQKDWFQNVELAKRTIELFVKCRDGNNGKGLSFTPELIKSFKEKTLATTEWWVESRIWSEGKKQGKSDAYLRKREAKYRTYRERALNKILALEGKSWSELDVKGKAKLLRALDEMEGSKEFHIISPEGDFVRLSTIVEMQKQPGQKKKVPVEVPSSYGWGNYNTIEKSISVLENGSVENISRVVGDAHKVRNFYNNIVSPNVDLPFVTIDTHAINASFLRPMGGNAEAVKQALGSSGHKSSVLGTTGNYILHAIAYVELAKELSAEMGIRITPRELQSVTWEAIRALFKPEQKRSKSVAVANELLDQWSRGKITIDEYRKRILDEFGGLNDPAWHVREGARAQAEQVDLPAVPVPAGRPGVSSGRGTGGVDSGGVAGPAAKGLSGNARAGRGRSGKNSLTPPAEYSPQVIRRNIGKNNLDFAKPPSDAAAIAALQRTNSPKVSKFGLARKLVEGFRVGLRIDIPAYLAADTYVVTVHEKKKGQENGSVGPVIGYDTVARVKNPTFFVNEKRSGYIRDGVKPDGKKQHKEPIATVEGEYMRSREIPADINDWTPVGFNPKQHSFFYDKRTDKMVVGGEEAVSVGNTVFVKNPIYGDRSKAAYSPSIGSRDVSWTKQFSEDAVKWTSLPPGKDLKLGGYDTSFHLNTAARRLVDALVPGENIDRAIESTRKRGALDRTKYWTQKKNTLEGALQYIRPLLADLTASLPAKRAVDLKTGSTVNPYTPLQRAFPGGTRQDVNVPLQELAKVVMAVTGYEDGNTEGLRTVLNLAQLAKENGAAVSSELLDQLSKAVHGKSADALRQFDASELKKQFNPEFYDVDQTPNATIVRKIKP